MVAFALRKKPTMSRIHIVNDVKQVHPEVFFAQAVLVMSSDIELRRSDILTKKANAQLSLLWDKYFSAVWFYGDVTSEYARWVGFSANKCKVPIINKSEPNSVLDRYLQGWMKAPRTPP
jgi:hypothetical protein